MKTLHRALLVAFLFAITTSPLAGQGIAGRWIAEFDRTIRNENGAVTTGDKTKARLVLAQKGDSITGTFQVIDPPVGPDGRAPTVRAVRGMIEGNKVSLQTEAEARRNVNGEESVHKVTVLYDLTLAGDKLEGTTSAKVANFEAHKRPFSARREKP